MHLTRKSIVQSISERQSKSLVWRGRAARSEADEKIIKKLSRAEWSPSVCQYPIAEATKQQMRHGDESWKCQGKIEKEGSPYCNHHHSLTHIPLTPKEDLPASKP